MKGLILLGKMTIFVAAVFAEAHGRIAGKVGSFSVFSFQPKIDRIGQLNGRSCRKKTLKSQNQKGERIF